jgi:pyruvate/2-oxoglutarate dehydrogenase complex dihydrolipoamide acyltransferase (E2) component
LSALINRADPKLAAYLGIQNGQAQAQAAAAEARKAAAERMATATAELQQRNQQAAAIRQQAALHGINLNTGRRYGI